MVVLYKDDSSQETSSYKFYDLYDQVETLSFFLMYRRNNWAWRSGGGPGWFVAYFGNPANTSRERPH